MLPTETRKLQGETNEEEKSRIILAEFETRPGICTRDRN